MFQFYFQVALFFIISTSLLRFSTLYFYQEKLQSLLKHFYDGCFQILARPFNMIHLSVSVDCLFLCRL